MKKISAFILCVGLLCHPALAAKDAYSPLQLEQMLAAPDLSADIKTQLQKVQTAIKNNKQSEAIALLEKMMPSQNEDVLTLYTMLCIEEGLWDKALPPAQQMVQLFPGERTHVGLGQVLLGQNKLDEAEIELKKALAINPASDGGHYFMIGVHQLRNDDKAAQAVWNDWKKHAPQAANAFLHSQ